MTTAAGRLQAILSRRDVCADAVGVQRTLGGKETFTATAVVNKKTVATSSVASKIAPGNASGIGQIIAASVSSPYSSPISIVEFTAPAVGDVAPLRTINGTGRPYGATSDGNFWMATRASAQQFDTLGDVLGTVPSPARGRYLSASTVDASQNEYGAYNAEQRYTCYAARCTSTSSPQAASARRLTRAIDRARLRARRRSLPSTAPVCCTCTFRRNIRAFEPRQCLSMLRTRAATCRRRVRSRTSF